MRKLCYVLFIIIMFDTGDTDRIKDLIYYDSGAINACFRRLDANRQIGCSSVRGGNVGVLHYAEAEVDVQWLVDKGPHKPYIVLLSAEMFNMDVFQKLNISEKINGILIISSENRTEEPEVFSPDTPCPNSNYEMYKGDDNYASCVKNKWNPDGNGLLMEDINFPIVIMENHTTVDFFIKDCYKRFNEPINGVPRTYPLCGAEVVVEMDAIKDTPTCLRRGQPRNFNPQTVCEPLSDRNVYSFLNPIPFNNTAPAKDDLKNKSVIVASAKLDVAGIFEHNYPGAEATVVGFVSLLAAAEALGKVKHTISSDTDKHIMFSFFQGESFDYIGSSRMVYDMMRGDFPYDVAEGSEGPHPINTYHIHSYLELSQVGLPQENTLWLHADARSRILPHIDTQTTAIQHMMTNHGKDVGLNIQAAEKELPLPPASLQSFLKHDNFSGVVLADHHHIYSNRYYNSRFDKAWNLDYNFSDSFSVDDSQYQETELSRHLTMVATTVARTLYEMSTGRNYSGDLSANPLTVTKLLFCFFMTPQCELFNYTMNEEDAGSLTREPYEFYIGIDRQRNPITSHVHQLLAYFNGDVMENVTSEADCNSMTSPYYTYLWMQGPVNTSDPDMSREGRCIQTTSNTSLAESPAFEKDYDWSSGKYSAWTESVWPHSTPNVRVFLLPDRNYEITCLCVGLVITVVSVLFVIWCGRREKYVFQQHIPLPSDIDT